MPQSLSAVYVHLVFSTKDRRPFLKDSEHRETLHAMLGGISKRLDCIPIEVGGVEDHVHVLGRFGRTRSQADWVKELKRVSTLWLREERPDFHDFSWQNGYATFSVCASSLDSVVSYVRNQVEHHRTIGFQDELRLLLRLHRVDWDERYVWD
jgi:putative transposase